MYIKFPYQIDAKGRTAETHRSEYIRDLIKQVLFTSPGERVNRPTFGSGLYQLVFDPNSVELISTLQFLVQGAIQQWLGDVIEVSDIQIEVLDSTLSVKVVYSEIGSSLVQESTFLRSV